ncbi:MAG: hypothetical protein ABI462_14560 [Ignavibacteria bacterium]
MASRIPILFYFFFRYTVFVIKFILLNDVNRKKLMEKEYKTYWAVVWIDQMLAFIEIKTYNLSSTGLEIGANFRLILNTFEFEEIKIPSSRQANDKEELISIFQTHTIFHGLRNQEDANITSKLREIFGKEVNVHIIPK